MGRTKEERLEDDRCLQNLYIGARVKYLSKTGIKTGTVTKFNNFGDKVYGKCNNYHYRNYTSVTVKLDDGKHISCSPRMLRVL